jgi:hypothetical protein
MEFWATNAEAVPVGLQIAAVIATIIAAVAAAVGAGAAWRSASKSAQASKDAADALALSVKPSVRQEIRWVAREDWEGRELGVMISAHNSDWDAHDVEVEVRLVDGRVETDSAQRLLCSRSTADGSSTPMLIRLGDPPADVGDRGPEFAVERITVQLSDPRGLARWERRTDYRVSRRQTAEGLQSEVEAEFREVRVR